MRIVDLINYSIIALSILIYGVRLLHIYIKVKIQAVFQIRIKILLVLIFTMFLIFIIHIVWIVLLLADVNEFYDPINELYQDALDGKSSWFDYPLYASLLSYFILSFFFPSSPLTFL